VDGVGLRDLVGGGDAGADGAKVSKDFPSQLPAFQVRRPSPRADTSIMPV